MKAGIQRQSFSAGRTVRIGYALLLLAGLSTLAGCQRAPEALCEGCNVVLVTIDALRYDHLGTYGHVRDTSPRMDALAGESVVFEHGVIAWPKTVPGLASILTGNHARTNRMMYATFDPMRQESTLLSEMLQENGYRTGGYVTNGNLGIDRGWSQGFDDYAELWKDPKLRDHPVNVAEHGKRFIDAHAREPFFLWLHYIDPHSPYTVRDPKLHTRYVEDEHYDEIFYDQDEKRTLPFHRAPEYNWRTFGINGIPDSVIAFDRNDVAWYIAQYDGEIRLTDRHVGEVIDHLKERRLWERTVFVLTADHGEALGDHDWYFDHGRFAYDDTSRIPMMIRVPGLVPSRVAAPVSSNDLVPTVLDVVGVERRWETDGVSLDGVLRGERDRAEPYVFNAGGYNWSPQTTVRDGRWKLLYVPAREARGVMQGSLFELYDLTADPLETRNLAEEHPEEVARLSEVLFAWMREQAPLLEGFEMVDGMSTGLNTDFLYPTVKVEAGRFYARVAAGPANRDSCFTLAAPNPDARITIQLLEANTREFPFRTGNQDWDDPELAGVCAGDAWGCLRVNGEPVAALPFTVRLGALTDRIDPTYLSLHGEGNDKTFCFRTSEFSKRSEETPLGFVVEVMGEVAVPVPGYGELDPVTRANLKELGYIE